MNDVELDRMRELEAAASPAPWSAAITPCHSIITGEPLYDLVDGPVTDAKGFEVIDTSCGWMVADPNDVRLLVEARNALPKLLDLVNEMRLRQSLLESAVKVGKAQLVDLHKRVLAEGRSGLKAINEATEIELRGTLGLIGWFEAVAALPFEATEPSPS